MCDPVTITVMALTAVQGYQQYKTADAQADYSNDLADAQTEAAHKAFEDQARATNARQGQEQDAIADKRMQNLKAYMQNMGTAQAAAGERGVTGRAIELDFMQRQADMLHADTSVNRALDNVSTAYAFERQGLESQLQGRIMQADSSRQADPSPWAAAIETGAKMGMQYAMMKTPTAPATTTTSVGSAPAAKLGSTTATNQVYMSSQMPGVALRPNIVY